MPKKIPPELLQKLQTLANSLDVYLKPYGFALLILPDSTITTGANYISNRERKDVMAAMKEFIARNEGRLIETEVKQ